ncbi:hypothetical protein PIIN_05514 [Serendipita indica DSM 11827]|uniref:Uncharacterized protein n=1 Tax=Serendipita indica (strain DSM 11827) TaxID=1109443 RepID=G4TJT4_SERID|nr:hypothetical protein PIIN_05514 [Serendipita indica DSM 11827]
MVQHEEETTERVTNGIDTVKKPHTMRPLEGTIRPGHLSERRARHEEGELSSTSISGPTIVTPYNATTEILMRDTDMPSNGLGDHPATIVESPFIIQHAITILSKEGGKNDNEAVSPVHNTQTPKGLIGCIEKSAFSQKLVEGSMSRQMLVYGEPEAGDAGGRANSRFEESKATSTVDIPMHSYPKGTPLAHINDALTQELWRQELTPSMVVEDSTGSGEDTMSGVTRLGVLGNQALRPPGVTPQSTLKPFDLYPGNIPGDTRPMRDTQSSQHDSQPRASDRRRGFFKELSRTTTVHTGHTPRPLA